MVHATRTLTFTHLLSIALVKDRFKFYLCDAYPLYPMNEKKRG